VQKAVFKFGIELSLKSSWLLQDVMSSVLYILDCWAYRPLFLLSWGITSIK